jgi:hypothetical protein
MTAEEAKLFVVQNKIELTDANSYARCVDGRYENLDNFPMIAKPGGDAGDVMAAFGALNMLQSSLPDQVVLDAVMTTIGGVQKFTFHTDSHADPNQPGIGCGHLKQAKIDPEAYVLTAEQISFILEQLPKLLEQGAHQEVLQGDHAEQATIVVSSEIFGLKPLVRKGDNLQEVFVYQQAAHQAQLGELAKVLQEALAASGEVAEEATIRKALDNAFGKQLTETLKRLANGLPVYTAIINTEGEVEIA